MKNEESKKLLRIIKDQIEERNVIFIVLSKESTIWQDACMKTLFRGDPLKYIDIQGLK